MTLNLVTPLFRSGMLQKIQLSIPNEPEVNWIIIISEEREILKKECEYLNLPYLTIPEPDTHHSLHLKVNKGIENLKPGFFQGLDDDTIFHPGAYQAFKTYQNKKLIIGEQQLKDHKRIAQKPVHCQTDGAQGLVHTDLLKSIRIGNFTEHPQTDCEFLLRAWEATSEDERILLHQPISFYNYLR